MFRFRRLRGSWSKAISGETVTSIRFEDIREAARVMEANEAHGKMVVKL
jgi:hypothetical protein